MAFNYQKSLLSKEQRSHDLKGLHRRCHCFSPCCVCFRHAHLPIFQTQTSSSKEVKCTRVGLETREGQLATLRCLLCPPCPTCLHSSPQEGHLKYLGNHAGTRTAVQLATISLNSNVNVTGMKV